MIFYKNAQWLLSTLIPFLSSSRISLQGTQHDPQMTEIIPMALYHFHLSFGLRPKLLSLPAIPLELACFLLVRSFFTLRASTASFFLQITEYIILAPIVFLQAVPFVYISLFSCSCLPDFTCFQCVLIFCISNYFISSETHSLALPILLRTLLQSYYHIDHFMTFEITYQYMTIKMQALLE